MSDRGDRGERLIRASAHNLWRALTDPAEIVTWRPPAGMRGEMTHFDLREGGGYRMVLTYASGDGGKSTSDSDVVEARFARLVPELEMVEIVVFRSDDLAFAGEMRLTTRLEDASDGVRVSVMAENVPPGISAEDHAAGIASSLENLARHVE